LSLTYSTALSSSSYFHVVRPSSWLHLLLSTPPAPSQPSTLSYTTLFRSLAAGEAGPDDATRDDEVGLAAAGGETDQQQPGGGEASRHIGSPQRSLVMRRMVSSAARGPGPCSGFASPGAASASRMSRSTSSRSCSR